MKHEIYLRAVEAYVKNDNRQIQAFLKNKNATQTEKSLIRTRLFIKAGDYKPARELLESLTPTSSLLLGEKHFLLAGIDSFESVWQSAACEAHKALDAFKACDHTRGLFLSQYNLSVYYNRLGLDSLSIQFLENSEKHSSNPSQASLVLRAKACHYSRLSQFALAVKTLEDADRLRDSLDDVDRSTLDWVASDIYFRTGELTKALMKLESLSQSKVVRDKAKVRFELTLLRSLSKRATKIIDIAMPPSIQENNEYRTKWLILENLQSGNWKFATSLWKELCLLMPGRYTTDFACVVESDEKTPFMTAVSQLLCARSKTQSISVDLKGKPRLLFEALTSAPIPLRKEELIEKVWGVSYDPAFDPRFYKLVERLRKDAQLEITSVNQTYICK